MIAVKTNFPINLKKGVGIRGGYNSEKGRLQDRTKKNWSKKNSHLHNVDFCHIKIGNVNRQGCGITKMDRKLLKKKVIGK